MQLSLRWSWRSHPALLENPVDWANLQPTENGHHFVIKLLRVKGIYFLGVACVLNFVVKSLPGRELLLIGSFNSLKTATIWHWQEKTVKISLGVVRRRFKIFFCSFFAPPHVVLRPSLGWLVAVIIAEQFVRPVQGSLNLKHVSTLQERRKNKSRGNQRKIKINSPCSCLYVCSLSLFLPWAQQHVHVRTDWLLLSVWFYCYTALLPRDTKDHLRSGGILSSFVILLFLFITFPFFKFCVFTSYWTEENNECTYTQSIE